MDKSAVAAARISLKKMSENVEQLKKIESFQDFESIWQDFLVAANRIYTKLEQGSKVSGKSGAWFAKKKNERKSDELLSYLHHARNVDEHTISPVHEIKKGGVGIGSTGSTVIKSLSFKGGIIEADIEGDPLRFTIQHPTIELLPVKDRGVLYQPPKNHLGSPLSKSDPLSIAEMALIYLRNIVCEATNL
ncbi:MAG: hypothetical protein AB7O79_02900 [Xanthobacteraceae bacterium]